MMKNVAYFIYNVGSLPSNSSYMREYMYKTCHVWSIADHKHPLITDKHTETLGCIPCITDQAGELTTGQTGERKLPNVVSPCYAVDKKVSFLSLLVQK